MSRITEPKTAVERCMESPDWVSSSTVDVLKVRKHHLDLEPDDEILRFDVVDAFNPGEVKELLKVRGKCKKVLNQRFINWAHSQHRRVHPELKDLTDSDWLTFFRTLEINENDGLLEISAKFATPIHSDILAGGTVEYAIVARKRKLTDDEVALLFAELAYFRGLCAGKRAAERRNNNDNQE